MANVTVYCANAFLLSLVLILAMAKVANRFGLVAMPSDIKTHDVRIPVVGAAMFVASSRGVPMRRGSSITFRNSRSLLQW